MRVKKLIMQAFGPYAGRTEIDFSAFGEGGIYIITGATGSGKTTIFDGISFALYGRASGDERDFEGMRCTYSPASMDTFVELTFEHIGAEYTVRRSPRYERAKARGSGTTTQNSSATLIMPDGSAITGEGKVTAQIRLILGLDREQYARTAMIAQGDFYKILYASTAERVEIFRKIFSTGNYGELQRRLFEEAKRAEGDCAELRRSIEENIISALGTNADLTDFSARREDIASALSKGIEEWTAAKQALVSLGEKKDKLKSALSAEEAHNKAVEELAALEKRGAELKAELTSAEAAVKELKLKEGTRNEAYAFVKASASARALYVRRDELKLKAEGLARDISAACDEEKRLTLLILKQREAEDNHKKEAASLENSRAERVEREHSLKGLQDSLAAVAKAEKGVNELIAARAEYLAAAELFKTEEAARAASAAEYEEAYSLFLKNRAGVLAAQLKEGAPCPVCGSLTHPHKAEIEENAPTEERLNELKRIKEEASSRAGERAEKAGALKSALIASARACAAQMGEFAKAEPTVDGVTGALPALKAAEEALEQNIRRVSFLKARAEEGEKRYSELSGIIADCEKYLNDYTARRDEAVARRSALEKEKAKADGELLAIKTDFATLQAFDTEVERRRKEVENYDRAMAAAEGKRSSCSGELYSLDGRRKLLEEKVKGYIPCDKNAALLLKATEKEIEDLTDKKELTRSLNREKKTALEFIDVRLPLYKKAAERVGLTRALSDSANGSLSGKSKIKLETYVQLRCFDRVLARANVRLENMTCGEYTLVRRESSAASSTGLELDIRDNYRLTVREVSTLSGGESFLASLALALGLSDEVQSTKGGVRIDSMFLDEGFGTLSDEALNNAVNTLASLSDGRISIGVISHVKELERRIDKKLIVTKTPTGSNVKIEN